MKRLKFKNIKLYAGAMSLQCVDAVLEIQDVQHRVGFISSRRQIDSFGGYVNKWTTASFSKHVREKNSKIILCRDHGGELQGSEIDDGMSSFKNDLEYFDIIHIDPWKKNKDITKGTEKTVEIIKNLLQIKKDAFFEVGTEEAIRKFSIDELRLFLKTLKEDLTSEEFERIVYCVVQSGVGLDLPSMKNTGIYSRERLVKMIEVCKDYNLLTKEHNADYLTPSQIKDRYDSGLDAANIAPELGQIQTGVYLDYLKKKNQLDMYNRFFITCSNSKKWLKWVDEDFEPSKNKDQLILTSGHYIFSNTKNDFPEFEKLDENVKLCISKKINSILETMD